MTMFGDTIFTPRLTLRKITADDLALLVSWSNSDSAHGSFLTPDKLSMAAGQEKIASGVFWNDKNKPFSSSIVTGHRWAPSPTGYARKKASAR
jgi:hypothetical protein